MGALDIELGSEPIEASLLASQCGGGGTRGFLLERLVHALVPSVLLGMAGRDELWVDAQANPPDGESAQSSPLKSIHQVSFGAAIDWAGLPGWPG